MNSIEFVSNPSMAQRWVPDLPENNYTFSRNFSSHDRSACFFAGLRALYHSDAFLPLPVLDKQPISTRRKIGGGNCFLVLLI
jgi:hypothetical protein